jgi:hypothetical protein
MCDTDNDDHFGFTDSGERITQDLFDRVATLKVMRCPCGARSYTIPDRVEMKPKK